MHTTGFAGQRTTAKIRHAQLAQFDAAAAALHAQAILSFLDRHYPDVVAGLARDALLRRIRWGLSLVHDLGVTDGKIAALFVVTQFAAGPTFHLHPDCAAVLDNPRLPPNARVAALFDASSTIEWERVAATRDDGVWPDAGNEGGDR